MKKISSILLLLLFLVTLILAGCGRDSAEVPLYASDEYFQSCPEEKTTTNTGVDDELDSGEILIP